MARRDLNDTLLAQGEDAVRARLDAAQPHRPDFGIKVTFDGDGIIEPGRELIKRIAPDVPGQLLSIAGQSQAGKSFIAVRQAISLASGEPFFGYPIREKVGVIYLAAEGEGAIDRRFKVAKDALGVTTKLPIATIKERLNLADKKQRQGLIGKMERLADHMVKARMCTRIGLIYVDTVAAAISMRDENDNAEISIVCSHLRDIGHRLGCGVSPLIHMGKNDGAGIRGGSNWTGHSDVVTSVYCDRDKAGNAENRRIAITKHRDGEEGPISGFELRFVEIGKHPLYGDPYGSCVIEPCAADWKPKTSKEGAPNRTRQTLDDAFTEIYLAGTTPRRIRGDGPLVNAVMLDSVEREFKRRYVSEGDTSKKQVENRKKAWQRALDTAVKSRAYAADVDRECRQWLWKIGDD